ncbi:putative mitochondrial hypothetical protein [Leptomonas pyrrhocoris]|uniref:Uncharacterized protein n=1 Tax=Leptomonas pyrrhocoris TaxID=157538 RepID=A0A0N0VGC1_LEPPY|nr:putative mitochondrial hypothetical protein [Leptomonas pyrrhocoris]XP_015661694.1 putative mitochondrial hypothetical protein [Leptomonas pyrrhocoris]KPA83254.1 putative mitochondrial hypothetical protein [Leptomonas pyrrhocoris]KPA83255.1 putative mitochondrial hypothetical protein [Leptomonas pyrrhocoris]|eukprot:XP_015661693.1 putative mitochondrial hypothetical protein [Leptomonas pyrrhocoris]
MWRRLPAACTPWVGRRLRFPTRRFSATTSVCRATSQHTSPPAHDDFFVDIDSLAGFSDAAAPVDRSPGQQADSPAHPSSTSNVLAPDVLGVIRHIPEEEGARFSRLQIQLAASENEAGSYGARVRSNTRAGLELGEEARYADRCAVSAEKTKTSEGAKEKEESSEGGISALEGIHPGDAHKDGSRLPDPTHLPYDDERFAEMLLEMEVNGVIDETWQDANKAYIEDVKEIADILASLKVRDLCCIDVSEKTSNFDYMMFGTCEGARHIHLAAWAAQDADKVHRVSKIKRKQTDELWEVVPLGRIVLNLMVESFREEMTLERKWAVTRAMDPLTAANAPISEGRQVKAHGLWTLTLNLQDLEDFEVDYCKDILMRQM